MREAFVRTSGADVEPLAESRFDEEKSIGFGIRIEDAERFLHGGVHGTRVAGS